jgi:outer membrane protein TolC
MVTIPITPWSSRMWKANVKGLSLEIDAMRLEKQAVTNEVSGAIETLKSRMRYQKKQIATTQQEILPALQKNYQTSLLAFEQNSGELFVVLDAWQMLKMTQLNYLDQVQQLLLLQVDYEKQLQIR